MRASLTIAIALIAIGVMTVDVLAQSPGTYVNGPVPARDIKPLADLGIKVPLYVLGKTGKLYKFHPDTNKWDVIANPGLVNGSELQHIHGGRWIGFAGSPGHTQPGEALMEQYWLYDTKTEMSRLFIEDSGLDGQRPQLSPDGKMIAVSASGKARWPAGGSKGIYLFDLEDGSHTQVPVPSTQGDYRDSDVFWSADGSQLLILHGAWSYWVARQRLEKISARLDRAEATRRFFRDGVEIPQAVGPYLREEPGPQEMVSPNGQLRAHIDDPATGANYGIEVQGKHGVIRYVASAWHGSCGNDRVRMEGWLDDRHLVYFCPYPQFYVTDVETGKTAALFGVNDDMQAFSW